MAIEIKKGQNDWYEPVNQMGKEVDNVSTVVDIPNGLSLSNGVSAKSIKLQYVQLKNCKHVYLHIVDMKIPIDTAKTWNSVIAGIPDGYAPDEIVNKNINQSSQVVIWPDGKIHYFTQHDTEDQSKDPQGYYLFVDYFTAN